MPGNWLSFAAVEAGQQGCEQHDALPHHVVVIYLDWVQCMMTAFANLKIGKRACASTLGNFHRAAPAALILVALKFKFSSNLSAISIQMAIINLSRQLVGEILLRSHK